jgi:hypothetical protein
MTLKEIEKKVWELSAELIKKLDETEIEEEKLKKMIPEQVDYYLRQRRQIVGQLEAVNKVLTFFIGATNETNK